MSPCSQRNRRANRRFRRTISQRTTLRIKITPCSHRNRQTRRGFGWTISQWMPEDHASTHHAVTETGSQEEALGGQSADRCQKTTPVPTMQSYNTPMKVVSVLSESEDGRRNARSWQKHAPAEYRRKGLQPRWSLRK